ncbi:efflux RND transporter periplasmic adaptor subunit [Cellulomonas sp. KRMCY2]|uniref:efflux RND transporter periplasmic adaptor subunit n=1 Tax=Cellulomonas sp. KRMCY2 TaxID=1304865 RepID=UPI001E571F8F|nr:biotin/lipoyl-binding protein [Cellulomonas sp. KRMCY2]
MMVQRVRRTTIRARVIAGAVVVLVAVAGGTYWFVVRDAAVADTGPAVTGQVVAASLATLEQSVSATGTLTPTVQEEISFAASGTVTSVDVAVGQTVVAGQQLATIDTLTLNAELLGAKATLASAEARLADDEDADDGSDAAEAQIAADEAQVEVAQAGVDTATEAMSGATLISPVGGLLTAVALTVGQVVTGSSGSSVTGGVTDQGGSSVTGAATTTASATSSAQLVVVGTDSWELDVAVDDGDVALIAVGDQAEITVEDATSTIFGVVTEIGLISTSTSGVAAYPVVIAVTGRPEGVHDGVSADVEIIYERRSDALTVPSAAVRTVDGESVVTQSGSDGEAVSTVVTVGQTMGDLTEITSGLVEGDEVVVSVVAQTDQQGTGTDGETTEEGGTGLPGGEFDPGQLPEGFDPEQMPTDGQMPGGPTGG